ncbi:MAG: LLM class F420-dependent oxidoreductase [Alphaproteobacteria bacterium]|nr:LLM class F420-dependent oxidoreductase [Alphaproteobacteria bacterium]
MRFGAVFPQLEIGNDPVAIRDFGQAVEAMGFAHLIAYDHVLGAHPRHFRGKFAPRYTHLDPFHEPLVLFGYLAAATRRIVLATGIIVLPQRNAVLVAKQAAALDVLSGGRLRLGVGAGWNFAEYAGLGADFKNRGKVYSEQLDLMNALWQKPLVRFRGKYHRLDDLGLNPLPVQRPIPLWFGGQSDAAMKRVVKWGQGWIAEPPPGPDGKAMIERLHAFARKAKRKPGSIRIDRVMYANEGKVADWRRDIAFYRSVGVTDVSLDTQRAGFKNVDQHLKALRQFSELAAEFAG